MGIEERGLGPSDLRAARQRVHRGARVTPLIVSETLAERLGCPVALKCESLQVGGAFKIRGATNFTCRAIEEGRPGGLITYSSGNHAIAVSIAARRAGIPAVVVMPETALPLKVQLARDHGAEVHFRGTTSLERRALAESIGKERGLTMVPPFDHPWIVAGQASCATEILEQMPEVETIVVPVGGGGLLSGIALACGYHRARIHVIGAEPEGAACMAASLRAGAPVTLASVGSIADGLLPSRPGGLNFALAQRFVADIVTVSDDAIRAAALWLLRSEHLLAEWSGAAAVAALLTGAVRGPAGPTAAVVSGGNIEPRALLDAAEPAARAT
ncbi:MAG: threonine/serine dehydratase [Acidobacteriota bacterium]